MVWVNLGGITICIDVLCFYEGSMAFTKVSCEVIFGPWTVSRDSSGRSALQCGEVRPHGSAGGSFLLCVQSTYAILLYTRYNSNSATK